jgi:O-antigen/teichoic acid export membrane protein
MTIPQSKLARNTAWMSLGQGFRFAVQAVYFTVIARSLGSQNYGTFVGVAALVSMLYPFGSLGSGNLLIKNVARDPKTFHKMWGISLLTTACCGSMLVLVVLGLSTIVLPSGIPVRLVLCVALSDIVGLSLITIAGQAFQAMEQLRWTAAIQAGISSLRLLAALLLITIWPRPTAMEWGYAYFASTVAIVTGAIVLVTRKLGYPNLSATRSLSEFREGLYFSIGLSAQTIYNDIDKTMLARLGTLQATGIYGAAYRLVDVSFAPIAGLLYSAYPTLFRLGASGVGQSLGYAKRLLVRAEAFALIAAGTMFIGAGAVPLVLGPEYRETANALRWLAIMPCIKAIHYFISDALSGGGYQGIRCAIQTGVAVFNVGINFWLIPAYSWRGAAWSSIASDGLLALAVAVTAMFCARRDKTMERNITSIPKSLHPLGAPTHNLPAEEVS